MPDKKAAGLFAPLGGALCRLRGGLGRFDGIPRAVSRFCGGVFLFNGLLLLPTRQRITRKAGVLFQALLI